MRPIPSASAQNERIVVVGIDPAATAGLVALSVLADRPGYEDAWRWVAHAVIHASASTKTTKIENKLTLAGKCVSFLNTVRAAYIAIERPADMEARVFIPGGQGQAQRVNAMGTSFAIGEAFGILATAAHMSGLRVYAYPVTSRKASAKHDERVGWMPTVRTGNFSHVMKRENLLSLLQSRAYAVRDRAHLGRVYDRPNETLDVNVLMAFGVLNFHLSRQLR
jgi:hypothetical protein